jgi:bacterioferritin-associated ferredoxin
MLVCHCNGVSDRTVRRVVREGALTVGEVGRACGAGTCCQGCSPTINRIIRIESHRQAQSTESEAQTLATSTS